MRVVLLGSVQAYTREGTPIDLGGARLRTLLARLALVPSSAVPSATLIHDLWGDEPPADSANALQALVSRLRKALQEAGSVGSVSGGYLLAVRADDVDAHRFEQLAAQGRRELAAERPEEAAATLGAALALWRGTALADLPDVPFAATAAARWEDLRLAAEEDRFEAHVLLGRHLEVLADLEAAAVRHPLRERLAILRMRALHAAGRQSDALAVHERVRVTLAEELGVDPSPELQEAHLAVLRGVPARLAPGNLPGRLTSFVGREEELELVTTLLAASRLVTIVGPGGAGKTRLAVEAMARHDRVWFVPLAGVGSPEQAGGSLERVADKESGSVERVADAVLGALSSARLRPDGRPAADPVERAAELLDVGEAVLVLDNCEHLVTAAAEFAHRLLERLPYLRILATSREALAVTGEALCRLGPLPQPAAVRLFAERAAAVRPGFALDEATETAVTDICRRLDGLPLALELAAARLRSMSVEQIARRLDDRFRLLTSGNRAALPRHRTLLAVVEWSWDLLTEQERALARRLSMFPAGAGAAAVEAVCSDEKLPAEDVVYVLGSLAEKSIVEGDGAAEPRYRMLETVRAYAAERLQEAGEREAVAARFGRHYLALVTEYAPLMLTARQLEVRDVFDADYDNLVFALRAAIDDGDADTAWRLLSPLYLFWNARFDGRWEGFVADVLAFGDALPDHVRAAFTAAHVLANNSGSFPPPEVVRPVLEDCYRTGAVEHYPMLAVIALAPAYLFGFDDLWERELPRFKSLPDPWTRACAHWVESFSRTDRGDWEGGDQAREAALQGFEEVGERYGLSMALIATARSRSVRGEYAEAVAAAERSVELAAELGTDEDIMYRAFLAGERMRGGDVEGAWRDVEAGRARANGRRYPEIELLLCACDLHRRSGDLTRAAQALDRLEALLEEASIPYVAGGIRVAPARMAIQLSAGDPAAARAMLPHAVEAAHAVRDVAPTAQLLARLLHLEGDPAGAATALGMSEAIRGVFDQGDPELRELVAALVERLGETKYAKSYREGADLPRDEALSRLATT